MNLSAASLAGYFPWLAPTTPLDGAAFITEGRNFYWTGGGVCSFLQPYLMRRFPLPHTCEKPYLFCEDETLHVLSGGVLSLADGTQLSAASLLPGADELPCKYKWSRSCVGCDVVYTHPCYSSMIHKGRQSWESFSTPVSGRIYASLQLCNRLVLLTEDTVVWSAIDDPCDLTPALESGAGFQSLNIAKYGKPLAMHKLSHDTAFVQTSNGSFLMTASQQLIYDASNSPTPGAVIFNFTELNTVKPCNANASAAVAGTPVWMGSGGLQQLSEGQSVPFQPEFSHWLLAQQRCRPTDACFYEIEGLNAVAMQVDAESAYLFQYDLERIGHISGQYDAITTVDKQLYALCGSSLYRLSDASGTASDTFVVTSALRLPKLNFNDRRREFIAEVIEVYNAPDPCDDGSYTVTHGTGAEDFDAAQLITQTSDYSAYEVCAASLYHSLRIEGDFHIASFSIEGRIGGLSRCP